MLKYYIDDLKENKEDARNVPDDNENDPYFFALNAAEYHYHNEDGWEDSWPMTFIILDENNEFLDKFSVELEFNPVFFV